MEQARISLNTIRGFMGTLFDALSAYDPREHTDPAAYFIALYGAHNRARCDDRDFEAGVSFVLGRIGISADVVADYLNVSRPTVARWGQGRNLAHPLLRDALMSGLAKLVGLREEASNVLAPPADHD
jgi:hypothetical protein